MKALFHFQCLIPAENMHPALALLEGFKIANVEIRTVTGTGDDGVIANAKAGTSLKQVVLDALLTSGPLKTGQLKSILERMGYKASSLSSSIHGLLHTEKMIKRVGPGTYALSAKGSKAPPKSTNGSAPPKSLAELEGSHKIIYDAIAAGGGEPVKKGTINETLEKKGMSALTANGALDALLHKNLIKRAKIGHYILNSI